MRSDSRLGRLSATTHSLKLACLLFLAIAWLAGAPARAADGYAFAADPSWAQIDPLPDKAGVATAGDGSRYLLVADQVDLNGKTPVWHRRVSYDVVQERALSSAGQFTVYFQPAYQHVLIHAIEVWRQGKRFDRSRDSKIEVLRREADLESRILDGGHTLSVTIPDLRVGDRIEYRYSIVGSNPVFGQHYFDYYTARYADQVGLRRVTFRYPSQLALKWSPPVAGFDVVKGQAGPLKTLDFAARNLARIREEQDAPDDYDAFGKIEVSTAKDWKAVAAWAAPLYSSRFADRTLAAELVRDLNLDHGDPEGSMLRAIAFVQGDIRYTALDMGQNSHAPNRPEDTVARRFGDCKDKAVLLVSLLAEAGVAADPVLVHSSLRETVTKRLPSALAFNHVVVRVNLPDGPQWVDATRDREFGGMADRSPLPFGYGLPISASSGDLVAIPNPRPSHPLVDVAESIRIRSSEKKIVAGFGIVTDYSRGYGDGIGSNFANNGAEEEGRKYLDYMRSFYDGLERAHDPAVTSHEARNAVRTDEAYRLEWSKSEGTLFGIVLFQLHDWFPEWKNTKRIAPISLDGPAYARQRISTRLDTGWNVPDATEKVENKYFSFERVVEVRNGALLVTGVWRRFQDQVPAKDYASVRRDMEKARELLTFDVDLEASYAITDTEPMDWLWALLALGVALVGILWAWLRRADNVPAGILFRPGRTSIGLVSRGSSISTGMLIVLGASLIAAAIETGSRGHAPSEASFFGYLFGWGASYVLRLLVLVALLKLAFACIANPVRFRPLLTAGAWANLPGLFFLACAMLAVGGRVQVFADKFEPAVADLPGLAVAGFLALLGVGWTLFSALSAYAGVANCSRLRAFGAMMLAALFAMLAAVVVAMIVVAAK